GAAVSVPLYLLDERGVEQVPRDEPDERLARVEARQRHPPGHFLARARDGADDLVASDQDALDGGLGPDLAAERSSCAGDRIADRARSSPRNPPRPQDAVDLAHVVVQED